MCFTNSANLCTGGEKAGYEEKCVMLVKCVINTLLYKLDVEIGFVCGICTPRLFYTSMVIPGILCGVEIDSCSIWSPEGCQFLIHLKHVASTGFHRNHMKMTA